MKLKRLSIVLMTICLVAALCSCGQSDAPAPAPSGSSAPAQPDAKPIEIKLTTTDPSTAVTVTELYNTAKRISERTGGMVDIQVYPDGQMLVYQEGVEALMSNANLIMNASASYFSDYVPVMGTVLSPYLYDSREIAAEFFVSEYWGGIVEECKAKGFYPICNNGLIGYRSVIASTPVNTLAEMQKLDLRIPSSDVMIQLFTALGVNYQTLAFADTFSACQTGMIDGLEGVPLTITSNSLWDCLKPCVYSKTNHTLDVYGMFVGYDFWMSIPEEYRAVIEEELTQWGIDATAACVREEETTIAGTLEEHGVQVVEIADLSEFKAAAEKVITNQPRGQEVLDQVAAIAAKQG